MFQQQVDRHRRLFQRGLAQVGRAVVHHQVQGAVAEYRQPGQGEAQRDQQHPADQFAHAATAGDAGDEHTDEGRPGNPPGPVEQGPQAQPFLALAGAGTGVDVEVEGLQHQAVEIVAEVLYEAVEQFQGRTADQHEQQQRAEQHDIQVGQPADAFLDTGDRRQGGDQAHRQDHRQQGAFAVRHAGQVLETGRHLQGADAQVGHQPEKGDEDAEAIHRVARGAFHPALAEDRIERRAQRQRLAMAVGEITDGEADQGIDRPTVQAPVEEGQLQRLARRLRAAGNAFGWMVEVVDRLGCGEVEQRDADPGGEQHAGPGAVAEVRLFMLLAELEGAEAREGHPGDEEQVGADGQHVVPAEAVRQPLLDAAEQGSGAVGIEDEGGGQNQDQCGRAEEHDRIQTYLLVCFYWRSSTHWRMTPWQ